MTPHDKIRKLINTARVKRAWSVYKLAQVSGVEGTSVRRYLNGQTESLSGEKLDALCGALEIELEVLRKDAR